MKSLKAGEEALKRNVNRACGRDTQTEEDRETSERASERTAGVYASKVSYGVTSDELTSRQWGSYTPHTRAHCWHTGLRRNRARTHTYTHTLWLRSLRGCSPSAAQQELICGSGKRNRSNNIPYYDVTRDTGSRVRVSRAYRVDRAPVPCTYLAYLTFPLACISIRRCRRAWKVLASICVSE